MRYSVLRDSQPRNKNENEGKRKRSFIFIFVGSSEWRQRQRQRHEIPFPIYFFCCFFCESTILLFFFFLFSHTLVIARKCFKYLLNIFLLLLCLLPRSLSDFRSFSGLWFCLFIYFCCDQIFVIYFIGRIKRDEMRGVLWQRQWSGQREWGSEGERRKKPKRNNWTQKIIQKKEKLFTCSDDRMPEKKAYTKPNPNSFYRSSPWLHLSWSCAVSAGGMWMCLHFVADVAKWTDAISSSLSLSLSVAVAWANILHMLYEMYTFGRLYLYWK